MAESFLILEIWEIKKKENNNNNNFNLKQPEKKNKLSLKVSRRKEITKSQSRNQ